MFPIARRPLGRIDDQWDRYRQVVNALGPSRLGQTGLPAQPSFPTELPTPPVFEPWLEMLAVLPDYSNPAVRRAAVEVLMGAAPAQVPSREPVRPPIIPPLGVPGVPFVDPLGLDRQHMVPDKKLFGLPVPQPKFSREPVPPSHPIGTLSAPRQAGLRTAAQMGTVTSAFGDPRQTQPDFSPLHRVAAVFADGEGREADSTGPNELSNDALTRLDAIESAVAAFEAVAHTGLIDEGGAALIGAEPPADVVQAVGELVLSLLPGTGELLSARDAYQAFLAADAALDNDEVFEAIQKIAEGTFHTLGAMPVVGVGVRLTRTAAKGAMHLQNKLNVRRWMRRRLVDKHAVITRHSNDEKFTEWVKAVRSGKVNKTRSVVWVASIDDDVEFAIRTALRTKLPLGGILMSDREIGHIFRDAKRAMVEPEIIENLRRHMREPAMILLERNPKSIGNTSKENTVLFVLDLGKNDNADALVKVAVKVDFELKKFGLDPRTATTQSKADATEKRRVRTILTPFIRTAGTVSEAQLNNPNNYIKIYEKKKK